MKKDLYKLVNNSVFDKTMENLRKRVDIKLVHEETRIQQLLTKPSFARQVIFDNDLAGLHMGKERLILNRPIYVRMSILNISKLLMYGFYYDMKKQHGDEISLIYTDTDSLVMEIETPDFYQDMARQIDLYDTSDFSKDHYLRSLKKYILGQMKDECARQPIFECVCLRPKMYYIFKDDDNIKKAKVV